MARSKRQVTIVDIEKCTVVNFRHGNMGYVKDENGNYTDRHKGYSYGFRCVQYPRMTFEDRHYTLDDAGWERTYYVDGDKCEYEDIPSLLNHPPQLTLAEFYVLERIGDKVDHLYEVISYAAGCVQPEEHFVDSATRWGKVYNVIESLREKGLVKMQRGITKRVK